MNQDPNVRLEMSKLLPNTGVTFCISRSLVHPPDFEKPIRTAKLIVKSIRKKMYTM